MKQVKSLTDFPAAVEGDDLGGGDTERAFRLPGAGPTSATETFHSFSLATWSFPLPHPGRGGVYNFYLGQCLVGIVIFCSS